MIVTNLPTSTDINQSKKKRKNRLKEKLDKIISLHIDKIHISEYMTRGQSLDEEHVQNLMKIIHEEGYLPGSEIWVNSITGANGKIIQYRLIGGRHRLEACKRLNLELVPALVFKDLTPEEECIADRINNEKDKLHKPVHFIDEAEHSAYLHKIKGMSLEEIARLKNVSKTTIHYRIKISELPEDVKVTIVTVHHGEHFKERHARELCKLSSQFHQLLICKEIKVRSKIVEEYIDGHNCDLTAELPAQLRCTPLTFSEIKSLVKRFKKLEDMDVEINDLEDLPDDNLFNPFVTFSDKINPFFQLIEESIDIPREKIDVPAKTSEERVHKGIRFGITPMWLRHTNLSFKLNARAYLLLYELVTFDFRFKPDKYGYFFINTPGKYETCFDYLGNMVGVKGKTVAKKLLPLLKDFVSHRKVGNIIKFQINWNNLFEVYREFILDIPFSEGGLQGIEEDATGILKPTPYHTIYIQDGKIKFINKPNQQEPEEDLNYGKELETNGTNEPLEEQDPEEKTETAKLSEEDSSPGIESILNKLSSGKIKLRELRKIPEIEQEEIDRLSEKPSIKKYSKKVVLSEKNKKLTKKLQNIGVGKSQIKRCMKNTELTENVLKYFEEMPPNKKDKIANKAGYICKMIIQEEFTPPENFIPQEAIEESIKRRKASEEFGKKIEKKFRSGEITHFLPSEGKRFTITVIPNEMMFLYTNQTGKRMCGTFREWMEDKYFQ